MVRTIPVDERPASAHRHAADERQSFDPPVPDSLVDAAVWFVVATCIRRMRGHPTTARCWCTRPRTWRHTSPWQAKIESLL